MNSDHPVGSGRPGRGLNPSVAICLALFILSQVLFLTHISYPRGYNFDEAHYIPAAKQFLHQETNGIKNREHPPLAKAIMAVGIGLFGDRPLGWRYMSALFGSLTLIGIYLWALVLFKNQSTAMFAALLTLVNQLLYVQARIATLEVFMFAFMTFALVCFCAAWSTKTQGPPVYRLCLGAGLFFGLAMACKWAAVVPWVSAWCLIVLVRILRRWKTIFQAESRWRGRQPGFEDWYAPGLFDGIGNVRLALALVLVPVGVYFLSFLPYLLLRQADGTSYGLLDFFPLQLAMWRDQASVVTAHPYMSQWTSWPLMTRPIWFAFDKEGPDIFRCVVFLGNPLIMWGGLAALVYCLWGLAAHRSRAAFLIIAFYAAFYLGWAFIPRRVSFYYYYYPAGMTLSLAIAFCFHAWETGQTSLPGRLHFFRWAFLTACVLVFAFFWPVLSAVRVSLAGYYLRMWLKSWV